MDTADPLIDEASELAAGARAFHAAAQQPNCYLAAPASLAFLEEALQVLSAAWYQVAADASHGISREQAAWLMGTLHDVAAAVARCAGACREGRLTVAPIIALCMAAERVDDHRRGNEVSWPESRPRLPRSAA